jgi:hypothetical protein
MFIILSLSCLTTNEHFDITSDFICSTQLILLAFYVNENDIYIHSEKELSFVIFKVNFEMPNLIAFDAYRYNQILFIKLEIIFCQTV